MAKYSQQLNCGTKQHFCGTTEQAEEHENDSRQCHQLQEKSQQSSKNEEKIKKLFHQVLL